MRQISIPKFVLLAMTGFILSILTIIMGTPFLRALRKAYGPLAYWGAGFVLTGLTYPIWFMTGTLWILVGSFEEIEKKVKNLWISSVSSLSLSSLFLVISGAISLKLKGIETKDQFVSLFSEFLGDLLSRAPNVNIETKDLLLQFPSMILAIMMMGLFSAIIFDRRVLSLFSLPSVGEKNKLIDFKVPDIFIWVALTALLFMVYDFNNKMVGVIGANIVNVAAILYFFQGIAVIELYLRIMKSGLFMRFFVYFFIVGQLFMLVSILGVADFWMDFRTKMKKLKSSSDNS